MKIGGESVQTRSATGTRRPGTGTKKKGASRLYFHVDYRRLLTTMTSLCSAHQASQVWTGWDR